MDEKTPHLAFVLATEQGELTVTTGTGTTVRGVSRNEAGALGYQEAEVAAISTSAGLKAGQNVGVIGRREYDRLTAESVHFPVPARSGAL